MTIPVLSVSSDPIAGLGADVLVLGVTQSDDGPVLAIPEGEPASQQSGLWAHLQSSLGPTGVTGAEDELRRLAAPAGAARSIALIGLGTQTPDANALRRAAGAAARQLPGVGSIVIALPCTSEEEVLAVLEGAAIGAYAFTAYRTSTDERTRATPQPALEITVASSATISPDTVGRASIAAAAVHTVRDLVNAPPSALYPETFAARVEDMAEGHPVEVTVLREEELATGGYGGILGVGQGSVRGPRLVKVSYSPPGASRHLALVGKGITFDSGGLSLKPASSMVGMKYDMTGAATVLAVTLAAAELRLGIRVTAWLCLAENLPSGSAIRPNDVLRIRGGKTVEVLNTDAEGRLVLADGLVAASEEQPDMIIDVATLTGAARVALGTRYAAVMGDQDAVTSLIAAGTRVGENLWHMPLPTDLRALLNSDIADIANVRMGSTSAGMLIAGVFLKEFVGRREGDATGQIPWAHIDIAGTANNDGSGYGYNGKGPTGVAVRGILKLAEEFSRA